MSTGLQEAVQARRLHRSMATSHRSAPSNQLPAEVYGLSASAVLVSDPMRSGLSHQLSSTSLWSPSTLPGWWESPSLRHAVDKQVRATPSVLIARHEVKSVCTQDPLHRIRSHLCLLYLQDSCWLSLEQSDLENDYSEAEIFLNANPKDLENVAEQVSMS